MIIPSENIATAGFIVFISLFIPVLLTSVCLAGKFINPKAYFCGLGVFLVSELLIRNPLISALLTDNSFRIFASSSIGMIMVGAFSAGIIEESMKYAVAGKMLKSEISYKTALSFGLGGLCCEMVSVMGLEYMNNIITMILLNQNSPQTLMNMAGASQVISEINSLTPVNMVFDLITRLCKSAFFLASAVATMKGVQQKKPFYMFVCIMLHTMFNSIFILINNKYVACGAALMLAFIFIAFTLLSKDEFTPRPESRRMAENRKKNSQRKKSDRNRKNSKGHNHNTTSLNRNNMMENLNANAGGIYNRYSPPLNSESENNYYQGQDVREIYRRNMYRK